MNDLKQEDKISFKNKGLVLAGLAILLLGVALFRHYLPALRGQLSDTLFIAALVVSAIGVFRGRK